MQKIRQSALRVMKTALKGTAARAQVREPGAVVHTGHGAATLGFAGGRPDALTAALLERTAALLSAAELPATVRRAPAPRRHCCRSTSAAAVVAAALLS